jgi:RNA polymerase sigma-70 factor (ECF subfamily)
MRSINPEPAVGPHDHRTTLFTLAYLLLGSAADAEDVLEEALRAWADAYPDPDPDGVSDERAHLVRVTTRLAVGRLRARGRRAPSYSWPRLPEPLLTAPGLSEDVELADSVSMSMLVVLETLSPDERAVQVLREVFGATYQEIGDALGTSALAVREIAQRAGAQVEERRTEDVTSPADTWGALPPFRQAVETGDLRGLRDVLAPDVVLVTDASGAAPVLGADLVAPLLAGIEPATSVQPAQVNGFPALVVRVDGAIDTLVSVRVDEHGRPAELYAIRDPHQLSRLERVTALGR